MKFKISASYRVIFLFVAQTDCLRKQPRKAGNDFTNIIPLKLEYKHVVTPVRGYPQKKSDWVAVCGPLLRFFFQKRASSTKPRALHFLLIKHITSSRLERKNHNLFMTKMDKTNTLYLYSLCKRVPFTTPAALPPTIPFQGAGRCAISCDWENLENLDRQNFKAVFFTPATYCELV